MSDEPPDNLPSDPSQRLRKVDKPSSTDLQVTRLQEELASEKDSRQEERWFWVAGVNLLLDFIALPQIPGIAIPFLIVVQLTLLVLLARRWGVDDVVEVLSAVTGLVKSIKDDSEGKEN